MAEEIAVGSWVWTADGKELGRVKKVEESAFQVDAPLAFDYWLERTVIATATAERIDLSISNAELGGYKMDRPHDQDGFHDSVPASVDPGNVRDRTLLR